MCMSEDKTIYYYYYYERPPELIPLTETLIIILIVMDVTKRHDHARYLQTVLEFSIDNKNPNCFKMFNIVTSVVVTGHRSVIHQNFG